MENGILISFMNHNIKMKSYYKRNREERVEFSKEKKTDIIQTVV